MKTTQSLLSPTPTPQVKIETGEPQDYNINHGSKIVCFPHHYPQSLPLPSQIPGPPERCRNHWATSHTDNRLLPGYLRRSEAGLQICLPWCLPPSSALPEEELSLVCVSSRGTQEHSISISGQKLQGRCLVDYFHSLCFMTHLSFHA